MPTPTVDVTTRDTGRDTLRWYTRARRIPRLVGKLPGSERGIPGGPYTVTQAVGSIMVGIVLLKTEPLWGRFGWVSDKVILVVAVVVTALLLRMVKPGGRDPLSALTALLAVTLAPRHGRHHARPVRPHRPVQVRGRVRVLPIRATSAVAGTPAIPAIPAIPAVPAAAAPAGPTAASVAVRPRTGLADAMAPRTNLERMLVQMQES